MVVAGLAAVWMAAAWRELVGARDRLGTARSVLAAVVADPASLETPEGRATARERMAAALEEVAAADRRLRRAWAVGAARAVPGLAGQRAGLLRLVADARAAVATGRHLLDRADALAGANRVRDATVPLEALATLDAEVDRAADRLGALVRDEPLWGPLGRARRDFDALAARAAARLRGASDALDAARAFLGAGGRRRYFVAIQNNAEMRDQGIVLSYAVLEAETGRVRLARHGHIADLALDGPAGVAVPPGTRAVFGFIEPNWLWQSVNATADRPWSGRAMTAMYEVAARERIDGVVAVDVPGLAALLEVTGPVTVAGIPEPIGADNAARVLLHDLYGSVPAGRQDLRHERLADVTAAVFDRFAAADLDAVALGRALARAAAGGHLWLYSAHPGEQRAFLRSGLGAGPAQAMADRTFHAAVQNRTATKLDYYVGVEVRQRVRLTRLGTAIVTTTIAVDNGAPVGAAPSYQLGPDGYFTRRPGEYWAWVLLWGPRGATQLGAVAESGLLVSQDVVKVEAGERREVQVQTIIPAAVRGGELLLRWVPQPRLSPVRLEVRVDAPGWRLGAPATWRGQLDRTVVLRWPVRRP